MSEARYVCPLCDRLVATVFYEQDPRGTEAFDAEIEKVIGWHIEYHVDQMIAETVDG